MALTPNEILHKEFDTKFRGFDQEQVNDFLDLIVADFEKLIRQNNEYEQKINTQQEKIDYFNQLQESLNNSIVVANEAAERLKQNARKEAELILYEAEREADRLMEKAANQSEDIVSGTEELRQYAVDYRSKLQSMLNDYQGFVNDNKYDSMFAENQLLDKFKPAMDYRATNEKVNQKLDELELESQEASSLEVEEEVETGTSFNQEFENFPINLDESMDQEENHSDVLSREEISDSQATALSRDELEDYNSSVDEENEDDSFNDILANLDLDSDDNEKKAVQELESEKDLRGESVLGQTIRIELPSEDKRTK